MASFFALGEISDKIGVGKIGGTGECGVTRIRHHRGRVRAAATAAAMAAAVLGIGVPARAQTESPGDGAAGAPPGATAATHGPHLQVTFDPPGMPTQAVPGQTALAHFLVTNPGRDAVPVAIHPATPIPGDNGQLTFEDSPDPRFGSGVSWSPSRFVANPGSTTSIDVKVAVPPALAPGGYLLGFIVRPLTGGPGVTVLHQLGALVTLRVPGDTHEHASAHFRDLGRRLPVLGHAQLATRGNATLRIVDDGPSSLFAFHEVTADLRPTGIGHAVLHGHTPGLDNNLRQPPQLFMPGKWADQGISWRASPLGLGRTRLTAVVSYHAELSTTRSVTTTADIWVVSPWCLLAIVGWLTLLLVTSSVRARRLAHRSHRQRRALIVRATRAATTTTLGLFAVAMVGFGDLLTYGTLAAAGTLGIAAAAVRPPGRLSPTAAGHRLRIGALALTAVGTIAGAFAVVKVAQGHPPAVAWGVFAAMATWVILLRGLLRRFGRTQAIASGGRAGDSTTITARPA